MVSCHLKRVVVFFFFFPIWTSFVFFSSLNAMQDFQNYLGRAKTSKTMLNKRGESGHTCLVLHLRRSIFTFSQLWIMLAVGLSYMDFIMANVVSLCSQFLKSFFFFIINECWIMSKASLHLLRWSYGFYPSVF